MNSIDDLIAWISRMADLSNGNNVVEISMRETFASVLEEAKKLKANMEKASE